MADAADMGAGEETNAKTDYLAFEYGRKHGEAENTHASCEKVRNFEETGSTGWRNGGHSRDVTHHKPTGVHP